MNTFLLLADLTPTEKTMQIIGIAVAGLLLLLVVTIAIFNKKVKFDTRSIVYGGICVALSFALSYVKITFAFGGSITLAGMLPLFIYCYVFGVGKGLLVGLIYGILQFIQAPYFLNVPQFFLDYILPFAAVGLAGVFKKILPKKTSIMLGLGLFSIVRLACHIVGGITFYNMGYIANLPIFGAGENFSALIYSSLYNMLYMVPETAILYAVLIPMTLTKTFDLLAKMMYPKTLNRPAVPDIAAEPSDGGSNI
jgi:thiamine transporter